MVNLYDFYIAGPLFTEAEQNWNKCLAIELRNMDYKVFLPQETEDGDTNWIYHKNKNALCSSVCVIAVCDGADMDSGTAWECGFFEDKGDILAIRTDFRGTGDCEANFNLMIAESADMICSSVRDLLNYIERTHVSRR